MPNPILHRITDESGAEVSLLFLCPGCKSHHPFRIASATPATRPVWGWNGSMDKPTFTPSLLVNQHHPESRCHSFVTDGRIQFLGDCWHDLKNQTVDLPPHDWT